MTQAGDWRSVCIFIAAGVVLGIVIVWRLSRSRREAEIVDLAAIEMRDLVARRDVLIERLRETTERSGERGEDQLSRARKALEIECATVLREIDRRAKKRPDNAETRGPARPRSAWNGFLWGVAVMAAVAFLATAIPGSNRRQDRMSSERSPAIQDLRRALQQDPENLENRLALAKQHLVRHEMAETMEQTQYVLARRPDDPRALTYEALVRYASGETEKARAMLREALGTNPSLLEGWIHLIFIEAREGRSQEARRLVDEASRARPEHAEMLGSMLSEFGVPDD
ncbi:MAG: hypothetical protein JXO72_15455 [Vicinamibacteria bacterium]|nr:hypothetical protein [Vicinamibacteria bacterium]